MSSLVTSPSHIAHFFRHLHGTRIVQICFFKGAFFNHENMGSVLGQAFGATIFGVSQKMLGDFYLGSFCHPKVFKKILVEILGMGFL